MSDSQNMETRFTADNSELLKAVKDSSKAVEDFGASTDKSNKAAAKSSSGVAKGFDGITSSVKALRLAFKSLVAIKIGKFLAGAVQSSISYIERMNLFRVATAESADELTAFANKMSEALGLDPSNLLKTIGTFRQLTSSMGLAAEQADLVTRNFTKAATDIASLFELSVESSIEKLEAGLVGLPKPLRDIGIITTGNALQMEAYALGIKTSVRNMSEINKVGLRYIAIMRQMKNAMGDFANTIESPANQLRIMREQMAQLTRSIGNLFVNTIARILPYINGLIMALRVVIDTLAALTGFKTQVFENSVSQGTTAVGDLGDELAGTAKKAKELLAPFDELNVLQESSAGAGAGGGGGLGEMDPRILAAMQEYDNLMGSVKMKANDIRDKLLEILGFTKNINKETGEITWTWSFNDMIKGLKEGAKLALQAWSNMSLGEKFATIFTTGWIAWLTGKAVSLLLIPFKPLLGGMVSLLGSWGPPIAAGMSTVFKKVGTSSAASFLGSLGASIKTGLGSVFALFKASAAPLGAALKAFFAPLTAVYTTYIAPFVAPIIGGIKSIIAAITASAAAVTAIVALIVLALVDLWMNSEEFRNKVIQMASDIWKHLKELGTAIASGISKLIENIKKILDYLYQTFKPGIDLVLNIVGAMWTSFKDMVAEIVYALLNILDGLILFITGVFTGDWSKAWEGISKIFGGIWNGIVGIVESAINLIIKGINFLTKKINETLSFSTPAWMDEYLGISFSWSPNIPQISEVTLPWRAQLARGGMVPSGTLFEAGEQGKAEVLGNFAGKTTVMPLENTNFVDAMGSAVYDAITSAMANQEQSSPTVNLNIGGRRFDQVVYESYERYKRGRGYGIAGGVLNGG